jgi:hypothetical protein
MYIVNFDEYESLVTRINRKSPYRPIIVIIEMPEVDKVFSKVSIAISIFFILSDSLFSRKGLETVSFCLLMMRKVTSLATTLTQMR